VALIKPAIKLILRESCAYKFCGPALTLGVPEVHATPAELAAWSALHAKGERSLPDEVGQSKNRLGKRYGWTDANTLFRLLGLGAPDSLDFGSCEYSPTLLHDLNEPLSAEWHNRYGFILDPGTLEHIFDQRTCLQSISSALIVGGVIVHLVPIYSYNGGYYSINPNVLWDFYRTNGFVDVKAFIIMWDRYWPFVDRRTRCYTYREDVLGSRHALADFNQVRYTPHLLLFARKSAAVRTITPPQQFGGHYTANATALESTRSQTMETVGRRWSGRLQAVLPLDWVIFLQTAVYRYLSLARARRVSGFKI
jgi:hypothetical protein